MSSSSSITFIPTIIAVFHNYSILNKRIAEGHQRVKSTVQPQSLDIDVQRPFYSVAIVALLPFLNMGRERRWPRWIKGVAYR